MIPCTIANSLVATVVSSDLVVCDLRSVSNVSLGVFFFSLSTRPMKRQKQTIT